jgi:hypothetical protein
LEKYSGKNSIGYMNSRGVPESYKCAFPDNKLCLKSDSILNYRKVKDIPTAMYNNYKNAFLMEKSGSTSRPASGKPVDDSFESVNVVRSPERVIGESIESFVGSPRESVVSAGTSFTSSRLTDKQSQALSQTSSSNSEPKKALSWWEKMNNKPHPAELPERSKIESGPKTKTPNFFERLLSKSPEKEVALNEDLTTPVVSRKAPSAIARLNSSDESVIYLDGHEYHELIRNEIKFADIEEEEGAEEFADRFTIGSESSGEITKSEVSTMTTDHRSQVFSRRSKLTSVLSDRLSNKPAFGRKKADTYARERVKKENKDECFLCNEPFNLEPKKLMCKHCHIQIHHSCSKLSQDSPCTVSFNEEKIAFSFYKIFLSLLKDYRQYLKKPEVNANIPTYDDNLANQWFRKADFISEFDHDTKPFVSILVETQAYAQFILDRIERSETDYEIMIFDESIKRKRNRSRLRFAKEVTPFLNDPTFQISDSITVMSVNLENLQEIENQIFRKDPYEWSEILEIKAREFQSLVTESDIQMMRNHTNAILSKPLLVV